MSPTRQILAMGGGGFSMEPENLALDRYLLSLSESEKPKICFIPTASGDAESYIERFYDSMKNLECDPSHLALYRAPEGDLESFVFDKDIFYVGGGNTRNLLALWREWGLDELLVKAYKAGKIMAGVSAGSICWFEQGVTDSIPGKLTSLNCLGLLRGSNCPHYDGEKNRRSSYHQLLKDGMLAGIACDDGVGAHFIDEKLENFVTSRAGAKAFELSFNGEPIENMVEPVLL